MKKANVDRGKPVFKAVPGMLEKIDKGFCPTCKKPIGDFKDKLSEQEFDISGMCQVCQDSVFGA